MKSVAFIVLTCAIFFLLLAAQFSIFGGMFVGIVLGIDGTKASGTEVSIDGWTLGRPKFIDVTLDNGAHEIIFNVPGEEPVTVDAYVQPGENYVDYDVDTHVLTWSATNGGGEYKAAPGDHIKAGYEWKR
jgi:hypothetical protein